MWNQKLSECGFRRGLGRPAGSSRNSMRRSVGFMPVVMRTTTSSTLALTAVFRPLALTSSMKGRYSRKIAIVPRLHPAARLGVGRANDLLARVDPQRDHLGSDQDRAAFGGSHLWLGAGDDVAGRVESLDHEDIPVAPRR